MCKKSTFIFLTLFALVSGLILTGTAKAEAELVAQWKLDGNALDSSGNGYDGIETNVVWLDDAERGMVASFNGDDAYISTPFIMPAMMQETDFSWAFWYKYNAGSGSNDVIIGNREGGDAGLQFMKFTPSQFEFFAGFGANSNLDYDDFMEGEWTHCSVVKDGPTLTYYRNGELALSIDAPTEIPDANNPFWIGGDAVADELAAGEISDVRLYSRALSADEALELKTASAPQTSPITTAPIPKDRATGMPVITNLSWTPGDGADIHDVYLGTDEDAVRYATPTDDPAGVYLGRVSSNIYPDDTNMIELEYDTVYFWRVDALQTADPDYLMKGNVWKFSTELYGEIMPADNITATASSRSSGQGPEKTIDGSGLSSNGTHSNKANDMWLSGSNKISTSEWIQYEFDQAYNISGMYIWNYNEAHLGHLKLWRFHGIKDVAIEYSADGETWETIADVTMLEVAPGTNDCTENRIQLTEAPVNAMYIRINALSNHGGGGFFDNYGLSEIRFFTN